MSDQIDRIFERITEVFQLSTAPVPDWEACRSVEEFNRRFGEDFFPEFWKAMYDDLSVTKFLLPFVMQYFLLTANSEETSNAADLFIGRLDPDLQREFQSDYAVEKIFSNLEPEQREVVCDWLFAMEMKYDLLFNVNGAKTFWCGER